MSNGDDTARDINIVTTNRRKREVALFFYAVSHITMACYAGTPCVPNVASYKTNISCMYL